MSGVNKVILVGRLGADPEVRQLKSGQQVCTLSVATSESWNDKDGSRQERTEWHRVVVWGKSADHCGRYLSKGREIFVEGRIQSRKYTDRDGSERTAYEIKAFGVTFLGGADAGAGRQGGQHSGQHSGQAGQHSGPASHTAGGIPF